VSRALVEVADLSVSYGGVPALFGVDLAVSEATALAVLGANGAGKSTLARALGGLVLPARGAIAFDGTDITRTPAHRRARVGIALVPEDGAVFPRLSVADNLHMALRRSVPRAQRESAFERVLETFPMLASALRRPAGTLSGGQQQMLALARAVGARPRLLVVDEPSKGLAPQAIDVVFDALALVRAGGTTVVLIEQYVERALGFADEVVVLRQGSVAWHGAANDAGSALVASYLGPA
jgi:branched-chain amino acid transport system ATP-binding protein